MGIGRKVCKYLWNKSECDLELMELNEHIVIVLVKNGIPYEVILLNNL